MKIKLEEFADSHREWARVLLKEHWGSCFSVSKGNMHRADLLPGFVALLNGKPLGLLTYRICDNECEITTLNSLRERMGIASRLIAAVRQTALQAGCSRLWLITTNDNTPAVRFYQKRGFELVSVHRGAVDESRKLKPEIPLIGMDGIPIRDEIEMEMRLASSSLSSI